MQVFFHVRTFSAVVFFPRVFGFVIAVVLLLMMFSVLCSLCVQLMQMFDILRT